MSYFKMVMQVTGASESQPAKPSWLRRIAIWLLHHIVTVLMLTTWLIAGPGMVVAWVIEKICERLECWEIELESRNPKDR
jgi:hypothetical protein